MIRRIAIAYGVELIKALHSGTAYVGPLLVAATVGATVWLQHQAAGPGSGYALLAASAPVALNLLGLLLILMYGAQLVASDLGSGTIRMILLRPIRRLEYLAAKYALGLTYAAALALLTAVMSWALAVVLADLTGVAYGGEMVYTANDMARSYAIALGLSLPPLAAAVAYAIMWSCATRNSALAISVAIGLWFAVDLLKYPLGIAPFLFSSYLERPWQVFLDQSHALDASWFPMAGYSLAASAGAIAVFLCLAAWLLQRRDLGG